jgi:ComF family protein
MLGAPLAKLFIEYCKKFSLTLPAEALLIPIPLYKSRRRTRGFNQADIIAKYIGEHLTLPVANNILHKTKKTQSQVDLSQDERRQNIVGSFTVVNTDPIKNKTVILVDDIKTTGATLETAACVLDAAGAKKIWAITIAH